MHELGLVYQIAKQVKNVCSENNLTSVASITLEMGEVSGIVENYIIKYWEWVAKESGVLENAVLRFEQVDAVTLCNGCGMHYPTVPQGKQCPRCQGYDTVLLRGNEFIIREIEAC